jgi:hypothetical protein
MGGPQNNNPGCLGILLRLFGGGDTGVDPGVTTFPYRLRDAFLSPAEISFYHVLMLVTGGKFTVCTKVNLNDIFYVSRPNENQGAQNRISRKHVDFLLCDPKSMRPVAGIELDDSSHARESRRTRDELVEEVFAAAGLPLIRFKAKRAYTTSEIASALAALLAGDAPPPLASE